MFSKLTLCNKALQNTIKAISSRAINKQAITYGQKTRADPLPINVNWISLESSLKSWPFMETDRMTCSFQMESGSSETEGVKHFIVVLFT